MNKMILGGVTFTYNPKIEFPFIAPRKRNSTVDTYDGVAYFALAPTIKGVVVPLEWEWMPAAQYDSLNTLYQADDLIVFDPSGGSVGATTYNVIISELEGTYWLNMDTSESYRKNIKMRLLIMSAN